MQARYVLALIAVFAFMFFFYKKDHDPMMKDSKDELSEPVGKTAKLNTEKKSEEVIKNQMADSQTLKDKASSQIATPEQVEQIQKNFSASLRQMGSCLAVRVPAEADRIDPQIDNLTNSLTPSFGNMLVKLDDWTQWEGQASDGSMKRIRTEVDYLENNVPTTRLQVFKLDNQGMPTLQPTDDEAALNPTDEYLQSLRAGSQTVREEKASRGYFTEGEELVVVERNGKIQSFSMTKGDKTFSCAETDSVNSSCQCL